MKGAPLLIGMSAGQHRPGNAGELVGQGDHQHVAMQPSSGRLDPGPQAHPRPMRPAHQNDVGRLDEERPQVFVAALRDLAQDGAVAGSFLLRHQPEPGAEVPPLLEPGACANGRYNSRRDDRPHARHAHQALTMVILSRQRLDLGGDRGNALVELTPIPSQIDDEANRRGDRASQDNPGCLATPDVTARAPGAR